jgi:hypothetical protein
VGTCHAGPGHGPAESRGSAGALCDACHQHALHLQAVRAAQADASRRGFRDYGYAGRHPATAIVDKGGRVITLVLGTNRQFFGGARLAGWPS